LAHGNRERKPRHTLDAWIKRKDLELFQRVDKGYNHQCFVLLLEEINLSCSSVRNIVLEAAIRSPRKRRAAKHRSRRKRYPREVIEGKTPF
jgi:hypothetical protein